MDQTRTAIIFLFVFTPLHIAAGNQKQLWRKNKWTGPNGKKSSAWSGWESPVIGAPISFSFSFKSDKQVYSPTLIRSRSTSHMVIKYALSKKDSGATAKLFYRQSCLSEPKSQRTTNWLEETLHSSNTGSDKVKCIRIFNYDDPAERTRCRRFRVVMKADEQRGKLTVHKVDFGSATACIKDINPSLNFKTRATCNFEGGDCGFRNDACGLYKWQMSEFDETTGSAIAAGDPLLIRESRKQCNYTLCIPCLQPSGFLETTNAQQNVTLIANAESSKKKRSIPMRLGHALILNPSLNNNSNSVAVGIFGTPTLLHDPENAIISFTYAFHAYGMHHIVVGALCESHPARHYLLLKQDGYSNYDVQNFEIVNHKKSGVKCLKLHTFIDKSKCSHFSVQFQGGALNSMLMIDNIGFHTDTRSMPCYFFDNL